MATNPSGTPRRWNVEVDGIRWLPRLIDKARMRSNGVLGSYLLGHSPVDYALLRRLGLGADEFVGIATRQPDDLGVLAALRVRGFDEARVRRWSDRFPSTYRILIPLWDLDEGYRTPSALEGTLLAVYRRIEMPLSSVLRRVRPLP